MNEWQEIANGLYHGNVNAMISDMEKGIAKAKLKSHNKLVVLLEKDIAQCNKLAQLNATLGVK